MEKKISFPLFILPKFENMYLCFLYNKKKHIPQILEMKEEYNKPLEYSLDNLPIEKCKKCSCELKFDNCFYISENKNFIFFCSNCCKNEDKIIKIEKKKVSFSIKSIDLLNKLNPYLYKNKNNSEDILIKEMEKLINITNSSLYFHNLFEKENNFEIQVLYLKNFRQNFLDYFDIITKIQMNDLYLFFKNLCIIAVYEYSNNFLSNFMENIYEKFINFNVPEIQKYILDKLFDKVRKVEKKNYYFEKLVINNDNNLEQMKYKTDLNDAYIKFLLLDNCLTNNKLLEFKDETKIKEIKQKLSNYSRNYFHPFDYIISKKVFERKIKYFTNNYT